MKGFEENNISPVPVLAVGESRAYSFERNITKDARDPYDGFSVCDYTDDDARKIADARRKLALSAGLEETGLIIPRQTHSTNVLIIEQIPESPSNLYDIDAMVTRLTGVALVINTADCLPAVFADGHGVIAIAHAGWRGMSGGIIEKTIDAMSRLGALGSDIRVACGPHISVEAFEVGEEVACRFSERAVSRRNEWQRPHVSLYDELVKRCNNAGIRPENISPFTNDLCSFSNPDKFFSARRLGVKSGRTPTLIFNA